MIVASSASRVPEHTAEHVNKRIHHIIEATVAHYARHPDEIEERLKELDREWDIERTLQANAAALAFSGAILGLLFKRGWLLLPIGVTAFLFQHAVQGWCPPVPIFRRLGVRTPQEIEAERYALKALRGDFKEIDSGEKGVAKALQATQRFPE